MKNISKQEIISNLHDKITQFKSNFSKNKEIRKDIPELNFEINRDALKLFYKKKSETEGQCQTQNQILPNQNTILDEIYDTKNILNEKIQMSKINQNIKNGEKNINKNEKEENRINIGAKTDKNYKGINYNKNDFKNDINNINIKKEFQNNNINININNNFNMNNNNNNIKNRDINSKNNFNTIGLEEFNNIQNNQKTKEIKKPEMNKENNVLENLDLNNANFNEFYLDGIKTNKKLEKRDKSAPKITINQKLNNFYSEKPLTDKKFDNSKDINQTTNYNNFFINNNNNKKTNKTEELYQKLLINFNINSNSNKRDKAFYNMNFTNNNNNYKFIRDDNPNKSYGQINIRDTNFYFESNGNNLNNNYYNLQKRNTNYRNEFNLDHLKDLYSKKTEDSKRSNQSMLKSKMDMFCQELNEYKNANYLKKKELNKNKYMNNINNNNNTKNYFMPNAPYNDYNKMNNINSNLKVNQNMQNENNNNVNKNSFNGNKIGYNEISAVKKYLNELSKDELNSLPMNIKTELKDIFNILYQKLNE